MSRAAACVIASVFLHVGVAALALRPKITERLVEIEPAPVLAGETFEMPSEPTPAAEPALERPAPESPAAEGVAPKPRMMAPSAGSGSGASDEPPKRYGAVGERGAADVVVAFGRSIAQVASADPEWLVTPLGPTGTVELTLAIDDAGALTSAALDSGGSAPIRRAVERTLAFIRGRTFTAAAPEIHLSVRARTSPDTVRDESGSDVFAIGATSDGHTAFFSLSMGRRVDIDVDVKR